MRPPRTAKAAVQETVPQTGALRSSVFNGEGQTSSDVTASHRRRCYLSHCGGAPRIRMRAVLQSSAPALTSVARGGMHSANTACLVRRVCPLRCDARSWRGAPAACRGVGRFTARCSERNPRHSQSSSQSNTWPASNSPDSPSEAAVRSLHQTRQSPL